MGDTCDVLILGYLNDWWGLKSGIFTQNPKIAKSCPPTLLPFKDQQISLTYIQSWILWTSQVNVQVHDKLNLRDYWLILIVAIKGL